MTDSENNITRRVLEVTNSLGLHARSAAKIAETLQGFECTATLSKDGMDADGCSVLSLLALGAPRGSRVEAVTEGPQAPEAMEALADLFARNFGEE